MLPSSIFINTLLLLVVVGVTTGFSISEENNINNYNIHQITSDEMIVHQHQQNHNRVKRKGRISIGAERIQDQGTRLNVQGQSRIWTGNNGRSTLDGNAYYNRQFGGSNQGGHNKDYGAGIQFRHRF